MIMKKHLFFAIALAGLTLAGCSSDDFIADTSPVVNPEEADVPILFSSNKGNITRANDITGAAAAELLGNKFVVSGYKGSESKTVGSIVFDNYLVEYAANTAYTTESNTRNWEYVGKGRIKHAIDNGITNQTIKYWDFSKPQYDFIAWSTGKKTAIFEGTPTAGQVFVSAIDPENLATAAYTMKGKAADLEGCYIADLVTWKKANYTSEAVPITFRSLGSKVRIGIYETVPGYSVRNVKFYRAANVALAPANEDIPTLFSVEATDIYTEGEYTIYFPTVDQPNNTDNNQAHVKFTGSGDKSKLVEFSALNLTLPEDGEKTPGSVWIGRTSNTASMAGEAEGNYYTQYLPLESGTNLNLRVNYVLEATDGSGEVIEVKGATAQVPLIYTQWKAGYAYTYLFKISDRTNGLTGDYDPTNPDGSITDSNPAGLYPITFDAYVENSEEDNTQETITTVTTPSITTYQKGSNVVNNNEYLAATGDIFVTVTENNTIVGLTSDNPANVALYTLPNGDTYTEADVVNALTWQDDDAEGGTIKGRSGLVLSATAFNIVDEIKYGADGNTISLAAYDGNNAIQFTPTAATNYAFVYTKSQSTGDVDYFEPKTVAVGASVSGLYRYALTAATPGDVQKGVKYFASSDASTGMLQDVFLGQTVNNLYLDENGTIASGYAVTGTNYYYTLNNGMSYIKAENIAYADFAQAGLYVINGDDYVTTTDQKPQNGTAYYKKVGNEYKYCVIMPQRTNGLYVIDEAAAKVAATGTAVEGMTYFDKFTKNDGVYYTKVIKVQ